MRHLRGWAVGAVAVTALAIALCEVVLADRAADAPVYTLTPVEFGMQLKTPDGRVVFEYLTKKPDNIGLTSPSAACFHPVNTPSGQCITSIAPDDHPHHRGIFFGWHDSAFYEPQVRPNPSPTSSMRAATVRRADFWGWGVFAPRDGRIVQNREIKLVNADAAHAELVRGAKGPHRDLAAVGDEELADHGRRGDGMRGC